MDAELEGFRKTAPREPGRAFWSLFSRGEPRLQDPHYNFFKDVSDLALEDEGRRRRGADLDKVLQPFNPPNRAPPEKYAKRPE
jgi:hypothetical protein